MKEISRRLVLKGMGIQLILPLLHNLAPLSALAASPSKRKNFIGVFFPNGTYISPGLPNGAWHWDSADGVLYPLKEGGDAVNQNVMILRNLYNGQPSRDPHWQNCAGFLSGNLIRLELTQPRCGKSIDQFIADGKTTPFRSVEIGGPYYHEHLLGDHPNYPHTYMNRISWRTDELPLTPHTDPYELFRYLFASGQQGARSLAYLTSRKKSVLDLALNELKSVSNKTSSEGRQALEAYATGLREIENGIQSGPPVCTPPAAPTLDYSNRNVNYVDRVQQFQKMLVFALKCELTNVGTIMYAPAVSGEINYSGDIGPGIEHHSCAHHGGNASSLERLKTMNRMHIGLLKNLLNLLKANSLLDNTLVLYGTDMNDGNVHATDNIPTLLCGGGSDLKFGQVINLPRTPYPSLLLSGLSLFDIQKASFGEENVLSTSNINNYIAT